MAAHDDGIYLNTCLLSVLGQSFESWECIVVDDASVDDTLAVALRYAELDDRFGVVRQDRNIGLAATRNTGIARARGEFVTMLDGDDFLFQDGLLSRYRIAAAEPDPAIAGSWCAHNPVPEPAGLDWTPTPVKRSGVCDYRTGGGDAQFVSSAPLVRTEVVRSLGGFDTSFRTAEDFEFWTRLFRNGLKLVGTGTVGIAYRQKRISMISSDPLGHVRNVAAIWDYMERRLKPQAVCSLANNPFIDPVPGIPDPVRFAHRMISFLTYAYLTGDRYQIEGLLSFIPDGVLDDVRVDVKSAINNALGRQVKRGDSLPAAKRHRILDEIVTLIASVPPGRQVSRRRHLGRIDLSRIAHGSSTEQPSPSDARRREKAASKTSVYLDRSCGSSESNVGAVRRAKPPSDFQWDVVLHATSPYGYGDLLTLGRELIEDGRSVAAIDIGDNDVRRRAEFEGIHIIDSDNCRATLSVTSSPIAAGIHADSHLAVCIEPWLTLNHQGCHPPDATIVRAGWEELWWSNLPLVRIGGWLSRASRIERLGKPVDGQTSRRRTETVLVLRSPSHDTGPDSTTISKRYGGVFDLVFGPETGVPIDRIVTPARVPVIMPDLRAVVVIGCAVPVDAIVMGTPVIMIAPSPTRLPDGVYATSFERLGDILAIAPPVPVKPPPPTDWLTRQLKIVSEFLY